MSNVIKIDRIEKRVEQASLWVARLDRDLDENEREELVKWMLNDPANRVCLTEMLALWDRMDILDSLSGLFPDNNHHEYKNVSSRYKGALGSVWAIAASACLISAIALFTTSRSGAMNTEDLIAGISAWSHKKSTQVFKTEIGEYSNVRLSDGSELILNTNTQVRVDYVRNARNFYLTQGEIHIDVAHDAKRPLSVVTPNKIVQAVGTAFNIQILENNDMELIVTDGKVLVAETKLDENIEDLIPEVLSVKNNAYHKGQKIVLRESGTEVHLLDDSEISDNLSWRDGNIVFKGESLKEALAEVSRYTDIAFVVDDAEIEQLRIAGMFRSGDISGLLLALEENFSVEHERLDSDTYLLTSR